MRLSDEVIARIRYTLEHNYEGCRKRFAQALGVHASTVTRWLSGKPGSIGPNIWNRIQDKLSDPPRPKPDPTKLLEVATLLGQLADGRQIVTGLINVSGVPNERISKAIDEANLTEAQKNDLICRIFGPSKKAKR